MPKGFRETILHVTSLTPSRAARGEGIVGHGAQRADIEIVNGLRVLPAVQTWCQLSATLELDDLIAMGDGLVRRKRPLATMDQLRAAVSHYSGRGCRRLREAFVLLRSGTDSARETALRLIVIRAGFPEPEVNGVILNSYGAEIARCDRAAGFPTRRRHDSNGHLWRGHPAIRVISTHEGEAAPTRRGC